MRDSPPLRGRFLNVIIVDLFAIIYLAIGGNHRAGLFYFLQLLGWIFSDNVF